MILSRLQPILRNGSFGSKFFKLQYAAAGTTSTNSSSGASSAVTVKGPSTIVEGPERDLINFPRPKQATYGGKVRLAFVPEEWFQFFYKKTGVTGPYALGTGLITFLISKEIYVFEHEFVNFLSLAFILVVIVKKYGQKTADLADKLAAQDLAELYEGKNDGIEGMTSMIESEKKEQWRMEGNKLVFDTKRENVALQLEAEYRKRVNNVYAEVKRRLDYQVNTLTVQRQAEHKHIVNWITDQVFKSISPQQEADAMKKCLADLKALSLAA